MNIVAFIFARSGSKGLPGKNIRLLAGKPLIAWSIEHARAVERIKRIIVSTDSEEIADIARQYGAEVPFMRPKDLSRDTSPEWLAWRHALHYLQESEGKYPDVFISIPTTAPLRAVNDINRCIDEYSKQDADIVITVTDPHRNPYFNMVKSNPDGSVGLVIPSFSSVTSRQDAPAMFDMTTVCYVASPKFIITHNAPFEGRVKAVHVPPERSIDIDTILDFRIAEFLFTNL